MCVRTCAWASNEDAGWWRGVFYHCLSHSDLLRVLPQITLVSVLVVGKAAEQCRQAGLWFTKATAPAG